MKPFLFSYNKTNKKGSLTKENFPPCPCKKKRHSTKYICSSEPVKRQVFNTFKEYFQNHVNFASLWKRIYFYEKNGLDI